MSVAVLSDIHGNYVALKRCMDFALSKNIKDFIFLGDYLGELAYPQKTMEMLYEIKDKYNCVFVKGNKEDYWLNYRKNGEKGWENNNSTTGCLLYVYNNLTKKDFDFFEALNEYETVTFDDMPKIIACHGTPYNVSGKMADTEETYKIMDDFDVDVFLSGHTHIQKTIEYNNKISLNAGAVGVPMYSDGKTQLVILNAVNGKWKSEFVNLEYNVESVIDDLSSSNLYEYAPSWTVITKHLLREGKISHKKVLVKAMELCHNGNGECIWPDIPEKFWEQAVKIFFDR